MNPKNLRDRSRYLGNPSQLFGVEKYKSVDGPSAGNEYFRTRTGTGLEYYVSSGTALDIVSLTYKGIPINYLSKNGQVSPALHHPTNSEFLHTFNAGMLYTCGLTSTGDECEEGGIVQPVHGRLHSIPASECCGKTDYQTIDITGKIRETELWGHSLELSRKISSPVGESLVTITDKLTNCTDSDMEFTILYHINFGYPFLSPSLRMIVPKNSEVFARTEEAKKGLEKRYFFTEPVDGKEEELFFHTIPAKNNISSISLENPDLEIGVKISWSADTLPVMIEWKSMKSGEYVLGIEPSNNYVLGRTEERKNGSLKTIKAFETITMSVSMNFYDI